MYFLLRHFHVFGVRIQFWIPMLILLAVLLTAFANAITRPKRRDW